MAEKHHHHHHKHHHHCSGTSSGHKGRTNAIKHLTEVPVSELINKARPLIAISETTTIDQTLVLMRAQNITAAPVWDTTKNEYIGIVSLDEILNHVAFHDFTPLGEVSDAFDNATAAAAGLLTKETQKLPLVSVNSSLDDLMEPMSRGYRRVLVKVPSATGKFLPFVGSDERDTDTEFVMLTQSDLVKYIFAHINSLPDAVGIGATLEQCGLVHPGVVTIDEGSTALQAFALMASHDVRALPVIDAESKLVATVSTSDLRGQTSNVISRIKLPVLQFLQEINHGRVRFPMSVPTSAIFGDSVIKMCLSGVHRLWILDAENHVASALSLTDVIRFLYINRMPETEAEAAAAQ